MTAKKKLTVRQTEQAILILNRKINGLIHQFRSNNPPPSWEAERAWEENNLSPKRQWDKEVEAFIAPYRKRVDEISLLANMELLTAEELLEKVNTF